MILPNYKEAKKRDNKESVRIEYKLLDEFKNIGKNKKYFVKTYGCQMNEHDSENVKAMLEDLGFTSVDDYLLADLVILNTCSIRENAHNKAFGMLGRLKHLKEEKKDLIIGICGCMAQEEGVVKEILASHKYVNFVFGTHNLNRLPYLLKESIDTNNQVIEVISSSGNIIEDMPFKRESNYKAYINIIYGCDKFCTYCIVPYTRGKQRSRSKEDILNEVNDLVKKGYKEVTLLGQNVNAYGKDLDTNYTMEDLLEDVAKTNIPRVRFMTSHPWDFTDKMIDVISKYPNICKSIHLPLQSGSNRILKLMGRRYTKESYLELVKKIKDKIPNVSLSTDIIVGFPNETEEDFMETLDVVNKVKYDNAFTFIYSKRENTPASRLDDNISLKDKEERLYKLNEIVNKYFKENNEKLVGRTFPVLTEGINSNGKTILYGYTDGMKLVNFDGDESLIGKIVNVKIKVAKTWSLDGILDE